MKQEADLKKATELLLEQYWIVQEDHPREFEIIKTFEQQLKAWFREKMGYELVIHRKMFARLEKIPAQANEYMVLDTEAFKTALDYTVLFSLLAFIETRYEEAFIISEFLNELRLNLGNENRQFLEKHRNRQSIIRVFKYAVKMGILEKRDGVIEEFEKEVLFKVPSIARFFIRQFPCEVQEGLQNPELWTGLTEVDRSQRLYRHLLLEPAIIFSEIETQDVQYLIHNFPVMAQDVYDHTPFRLEQYIEGVVAVRSDPEGSSMRDFPSDSSLSDVALQIAECLKLSYLDHELFVDRTGWVDMSSLDWHKLILDLKDKYGVYWKKDFSENLKADKLVEEISNYLVSWNMLKRVDAHTWRISPHMVRVTGKIVDKGELKSELET
ncbi:MAG: hypothetical protein K0Q73_7124 [Paenibacillus sp.]|jgi:uncharacterized protein (TIGR02678 family)|nr:hypothetical protein [Paenibacillus sp.]